jgi:hypothetical protein
VDHVYLGALAFGVTLLAASLLLHGGKDTHHDHDAGHGFGWAPIASLRFWVFLMTFGGGAGYVLTELGEGDAISGGGAFAIGWLAGVIAVGVIRSVARANVSSQIAGKELVGTTGQLVLPVGKDRPGKVRVAFKGRNEDFIAHAVDDVELPSGSPVLIVAEGDLGSLLVAKSEM